MHIWKNKEAIEHRQEAIHELSTDLEYRQQIRLLGLLYKGKPADTTEIKEWAASRVIIGSVHFYASSDSGNDH